MKIYMDLRLWLATMSVFDIQATQEWPNSKWASASLHLCCTTLVWIDVECIGKIKIVQAAKSLCIEMSKSIKSTEDLLCHFQNSAMIWMETGIWTCMMSVTLEYFEVGFIEIYSLSRLQVNDHMKSIIYTKILWLSSLRWSMTCQAMKLIILWTWSAICNSRALKVWHINIGTYPILFLIGIFWYIVIKTYLAYTDQVRFSCWDF